MVDECSHFSSPANGSVDWIREVADVLNYARENRGWVLNVYQSVEREQLERILHKIIGPYVENGFDQAVNGRPVVEEDRKFALAIYTHGITGIFLDWVSAGMRSDTVFLEDNLAHLFQNSLAGIAERCVAQQAGANN